jgi:hypothetical protein
VILQSCWRIQTTKPKTLAGLLRGKPTITSANFLVRLDNFLATWYWVVRRHVVKLTKEARAKISEAMKQAHAERAKAGRPWVVRKTKRHKKAGLAEGLVRQLQEEIAERQLLLKLLKERGL